MKKNLWLIMLIASCTMVLDAEADRGYSYYPYYGYGYQRGSTDLEISRMRRDLRRQQRIQSHTRRNYEQEIQSLRQDAFSTQQISSRQACYYRTNGGFEVCADLFEKDSSEFHNCENLVIRRNPSCNEMSLGKLNE